MNNIHRATATLTLIDQCLERDQGNAYRGWLEKVLPHIGDAYRQDEEGFRTHMGASLIGRECPREIWYGFHWTLKPTFPGRILRLFNRGHLEEGRIIALLLMAGFQVFQQDENGKQYRVSGCGGHFGGSGDGVVVGLPELTPGQAALLEFKTHSDKSWQSVSQKGVREAKFEHFVQMQIYMRRMALAVALYVAVNKNDDSLHMELVALDPVIADQFYNRAELLVFAENPPERIGKTAGFYKCKFCDFRPVCHSGAAPVKNCRTCKHSYANQDGTWRCTHPHYTAEMAGMVLDKERQHAACNHYEAQDMAR